MCWVNTASAWLLVSWQLSGRWKPGWKSSSLHSIHTFLGLLSLFLLHPVPWTRISQLNCYYANPCLGLCFIVDPIKTTSKWRCQAGSWIWKTGIQRYSEAWEYKFGSWVYWCWERQGRNIWRLSSGVDQLKVRKMRRIHQRIWREIGSEVRM